MKDHTVEYMSMDYYMKSEAGKERSRRMAEMGMDSCATPKKTNEEAQEKEQMMRKGYSYYV